MRQRRLFPFEKLTYFYVSSNYEFGLYYMEQNTKVYVQYINAKGKPDNVKIFIDDNEYDSGKTPE